MGQFALLYGWYPLLWWGWLYKKKTALVRSTILCGMIFPFVLGVTSRTKITQKGLGPVIIASTASQPAGVGARWQHNPYSVIALVMGLGAVEYTNPIGGVGSCDGVGAL